MLTDSNSCSDDEQNPKPDPTSIDQSLDAIENQLASISMSQSLSEPEDESEHGVREQTTELNHEELRNGSLDEIEQLGLRSSLPAEVRRVEEDVEVVEEPKASSSGVWSNAAELDEEEAPSSPSSSGYAGERGSSSSTSGIEEVNDDGEIHEVRNDGEFEEVSESQSPWVPGKRHSDEVSWRS